MNVKEMYRRIDGYLDTYGREEKSLITVLQAIQEEYSYLPKEIFPYLAKEMNLHEAQIYGVATFYENFSLEAKGKYVIKVCDGTACHVRKSAPILERLRNELGLSASKITTDDLMFTVQTVACLGACGLAPAMTVNNKVYASMTPEKAMDLLKQLREEA
ncbi:MAG: NAD(P)H-dependent oxidoreductase subunit E [Clostridia bacterium]|jgi:NADH:ubiquinone oxidoreductase 24 kD subunit|nr:NAD(P)H-dependent oxidoreductase subunit E [Clostridia bacterium]